jgi:Leucine-rich repeat (LRR) protein
MENSIQIQGIIQDIIDAQNDTTELSFWDVTDHSFLSSLPKNTLKLALDNTKIKSIDGIQNLTEIRILDLGKTDISDISNLAPLHSLWKLYLGGTNISSIESLRGCKRLEDLCIAYTNVTDLSPLKGLKRLHTLNIKGIKIDDDIIIDTLLEIKPMKIYVTDDDIKSSDIDLLAGCGIEVIVHRS